MSRLVILMNPAAGCEFYERAIMREAVTEKEKVDILLELHKEGKVQILGSTDLTKAELIEELSKVARVWSVEGKNGR